MRRVEEADPKIPCVDENNEGLFEFAVYQHLPCGCKSTGNGTLPHPLTVKQCSLHAKAEALRTMLLRIEHAVYGVSDDYVELFADDVKELISDTIDPKAEYIFRPRGIGLDLTPGCYVCGGEQKMYNNISGFVASRTDGQLIKHLFATGARLDYRDHEPNWIQVKIGACDTHLPNLQHLYAFTSDALKISRHMIEESKNGAA
jgi:hypothetical protein